MSRRRFGTGNAVWFPLLIDSPFSLPGVIKSGNLAGIVAHSLFEAISGSHLIGRCLTRNCCAAIPSTPPWIVRVANPEPCVRARRDPPASGSVNEEAEDDECEARGHDQGAVAGLFPEQLHRDRRAGRAGIADAAAPRLVSSDVRVLGLERLVARPRPTCSRIAERHRRDAERDQREVEDAHQALSPASSRSRMAACATVAFAWPRVAFITWPT